MSKHCAIMSRIKNTYVNGVRAEIDGNEYQIYEDDELVDMEWISLNKSVVRTKWEVVETPMIFKNKDFEQ